MQNHHQSTLESIIEHLLWQEDKADDTHLESFKVLEILPILLKNDQFSHFNMDRLCDLLRICLNKAINEDDNVKKQVVELLNRRFYHFNSIVHAIAWKNAHKYSDVLQMCLSIGFIIDKPLLNILSCQNPFSLDPTINTIRNSKNQERVLDFYPRLNLSVLFTAEEDYIFKLFERVKEPNITMPNKKYLAIRLETETITDYTRDLSAKHMSRWSSHVSEYDMYVIGYSVKNAELALLMLNNLTQQLSQIIENGTEVVLLCLHESAASDDWKQLNNEYNSMSKLHRAASNLKIKTWTMEYENQATAQTMLEDKLNIASRYLSSTDKKKKQSNSKNTKSPRKIIPFRHGVHSKCRN
jgi:hypothetical protein